MARARIGSCDDEMLRTATADLDAMLSASWPSSAPLPRQKAQPPRAPLRRPRKVLWEVPPLTLPRSPKHQLSLSRSGSDTTVGENELVSFTSALDDGEDSETLVFTLDGPAYEDDADEQDLYDIHLVGLDDSDQQAADVAEGTPREAEIFHGAQSLGSILTLGASPTLLSVLAKVAAESRRDVGRESERIPLDRPLSPSWPAAAPPSRCRLQAPKAPLRRPSSAPFEVLPLELPPSPILFSPTVSPRDEMSRSVSNSSLEKVEPTSFTSLLPATMSDPGDEEDEDEDLIFALDGGVKDTGDAEEDEENDDCFASKYQINITSLDDDACSLVADDADADLIIPEVSVRVDSHASVLGASPLLVSALQQVAAEAKSIGTARSHMVT